ncbi:Na(+)/H(+) antiporter subunit D [Pseudodesulfovibrio sediminis]|uniref:Na(+)/H(+) antiporter subunit D n=1 Tax=Pseudodesulfovibrio sediminis TaxID=2810563 RepID=A0ABN6EQU3_9BACT|nr:Na(+)/H(+) antiporter subunit D [Pseudodesulfovibrio sediminis]BCS87604.1 Na(+)/H(+) antiporter subunit D [Pseudodesulfovibrio sediminis]
METSMFIHPSLAFLAFALVVPFLPNWLWSNKGIRGALALIAPLVALYSIMTMVPGKYLGVEYLDQALFVSRVDKLSIVFGQVFAVIATIGAIYGMHVEDRGHFVCGSLYVAGGFGCVFANDLLTVFLFWELMSIGSTFLIWQARTEESVGAGFRYFLYHTVGGLFLLAGLLLKYKATGNFAFVGVDPAEAHLYDWLIMIGFCVNAAVVPLHAWLPDAYPRASIAGAVYMCAFTTKTAVYVLARGFAGWEVLAIAGTFMAVYGVLYACMENNARRILSYHIVSQVGYMVAGIGIGTAMTLNGAVAHAYAHILYKGLLFMGTGAILYSVGTVKLDKLGGLAYKLPWVMVLYMVAALSISGMPLFNGFISKTMTIAGAAEHHRTFLALGMEIAAVGTFISVGIKLPYFAFWGGKKEYVGEVKPVPWNMYVGMTICALLCIAQGVYPEMLYHYLPMPVEEHAFVPWTVVKVINSGLLLGFSGLAFYFTRKIITPHAKLNLDFDILYRLIGRVTMRVVCWPISKVDDIWTEVYRTVGLRALVGMGDRTSWFDKKGIDTVVDGSAYTVRNIGRVGAKAQTANLQDYLAWAAVLGLGIFALVWYFG